jgi:hypothetical protein
LNYEIFNTLPTPIEDWNSSNEEAPNNPEDEVDENAIISKNFFENLIP